MPRIIYGIHPVQEALRAGRVQALFVEEGDSPQLKPVRQAAAAADITVEERTRAALDLLAGGALHQGVVVVSGEYPYASLEQILAISRKASRPALILVLDGVTDPQNLGALVRSAHVLGADGVVLPRDRAASVTATAVKASAGATEHTPIVQVTNLARALEEMKEAGLWVVGAVARGGEPPWRIDFKAPIALVLGAEGKGIRPLVLRGCDLLVQVPMLGRVASLNVAAAASCVLYEAARQRA